LEGVDIDGPKIQDYSDPFGFSSNACSFSRYPHVHGKKIGKRWKQVFAQKTPIRLLVEKGIFTKEEFLEMVRMVEQERKEKVNA
jgi:hypothetical protein